MGPPENQDSESRLMLLGCTVHDRFIRQFFCFKFPMRAVSRAYVPQVHRNLPRHNPQVCDIREKGGLFEMQLKGEITKGMRKIDWKPCKVI